jgi:DNA repair photolyase
VAVWQTHSSVIFVLVMFCFSIYVSHIMNALSERTNLDFSTAGQMQPAQPLQRLKGRGTASNDAGRFEAFQRTSFDDGWAREDDDLPTLKTHVTPEIARTIIARNTSPDISFDRSVNPYRGCEHGCTYCYARPTHAYMGLSAGLDFESRLFAKTNAAELLRKELGVKGYQPATLALGANTDPYQPVERQYRITRAVLEVLNETNHPVGIVTKSALVTRDIDILQEMAGKGLVKVALSITTLDHKLARKLEPRAATPGRRLQALELLSKAGIPTVVMTAPVIPAINDMEIEKLLGAAQVAGAREAGYVLLRLPHEIKDLFRDWLEREFPDRAKHVMNLVRDTRGGRDNDPNFGSRMSGRGPYAWQIGRRFELACKRLGLNVTRHKLRADLFQRPVQPGEQLSLL